MNHKDSKVALKTCRKASSVLSHNCTKTFLYRHSCPKQNQKLSELNLLNYLKNYFKITMKQGYLEKNVENCFFVIIFSNTKNKRTLKLRSLTHPTRTLIFRSKLHQKYDKFIKIIEELFELKLLS